jgi:uncharacterized protein (TIGR00159 family)
LIDVIYFFLQSIRWQDMLDILLNSYILFRLYILFRGTHILRVLVGILFLLYFQKVAATMGLILTSWVIQGITAAAALIIIVVFKNEIRVVLQTRNFKTFFFGIPPKPLSSSIRMITRSVFDLSERHCGALIVFPGKEDLQEVVHSGIQLNGRISEEMIKSIFWRDNPVHDGACIISADRIVEVGVILPLSRRRDLPSQFGTRHRAAIGISEQSDALALVVSEETGRVSTARQGEIQTIRHQAQLEQILKDHTDLESRSQHRTAWFDARKIVTALIILMAVTGFWFTMTQGMQTLITVDAPVKFLNLQDGMEILETSKHKAQLQLIGSEMLIQSLRPETIDIRIDLSKAVAGENRFILSEKNINLPPGIKLNNVEQPCINVRLDKIIQKALYVQVRWTGHLSENLIMETARSHPETIVFSGPHRILSNISTLYTEPIPLDSIKTSGTVSSRLVFDRSNLKPPPDFNNHITIDFVIKKRTGITSVANETAP